MSTNTSAKLIGKVALVTGVRLEGSVARLLVAWGCEARRK